MEVRFKFPTVRLDHAARRTETPGDVKDGARSLDVDVDIRKPDARPSSPFAMRASIHGQFAIRVR